MKVRFTVVVDVDEEALLERNEAATKRQGVELHTDPTEWGDFDLQMAIDDAVLVDRHLEIESSEPA